MTPAPLFSWQGKRAAPALQGPGQAHRANLEAGEEDSFRVYEYLVLVGILDICVILTESFNKSWVQRGEKNQDLEAVMMGQAFI